MSCEQVFKDVNDIFSRLFNHKAALQGLIQNFVKEFEDKRQENLTLARNNDWINDCCEHRLPVLHEILATDVLKVNDEIKTVTQSCQRIVQDESEKKTTWLEEERAKRVKDWDDFMNGHVKSSREMANKEFEERAESLRQHYADLEEKLSQGVSRRLL